jgi:hypothetical protein
MLRKLVVDLQGRNQIDVNGKDNPSHYRMRRLSDFVQVPEPGLLEHAVVVHDKQIGPAGRITVQNGIFECEVDAQTGFVYGFRQGKPNDRVCREILQFGPNTYSDGILLPAASFSANYRFGVLDNFSIYVIDHAVLNGDIDPSTFAVSGEKDDIVVDHRVAPESVVTVQKHVSDILGPWLLDTTLANHISVDREVMRASAFPVPSMAASGTRQLWDRGMLTDEVRES